MNRRRDMTARRGMTLIEILMTLTTLLVIAATAVGILGAITEIGQNNDDSRQSQKSVLRLAKRFRQDILPASEIQPIAAATGVDIRNDDRQIRYLWEPDMHTIHRVERRDQKIITSDRFALSPQCDPRFSISEKLVKVIVKQEPIAWVVEAAR